MIINFNVGFVHALLSAALYSKMVRGWVRRLTLMMLIRCFCSVITGTEVGVDNAYFVLYAD